MNIRFDIDLGTGKLKGVLTLKPDELCVEWRRYNLFDAPVGSLESISTPFSDLAGVSVTRKFRRPIIEISAHAASTFGPIPLPGDDLATLKARVARPDRGEAEAWGAEASLRIANAISGGNLLES